jgi:ABC-2 type transport system ATP-binding protein
MPATTGTASVSGFDVFDQPLEAKRRTGYLPETPPLYPDMTVRDYLRFVARIKGVRAHVNDRVEAVIKKTWVADMANRHCGKLSKGYKQRVGLAQALIHDPEVLVLDEPTAGLDPKQIIEVRQLIRELAGTHTIVLSTHILPEVAQTCQKVVIINKGKVVATDTPDALTERLRGAITMFVQAQGPAADMQRALQSVAGVTRVSIAESRGDIGTFDVDTEKGADVRRELAGAIVRGGWGLLELRPMRMSLEDIFLSLTTEEQGTVAEGSLPAEAGQSTGSEGGVSNA